MKKTIWLVVFAGLGYAQTTVNGSRDFKGTVKASGTASAVDFSGAAGTAPVRTGTIASRPSGCTQGQVYFATDATAGQNLSFCTTTGAPGVWSAMSGGGGGGSAAGVSYCAPVSGSGTAYTCSPNPAVGSYSAGVTLAFVPDVNGAGGATTVNTSGLGAKSIKQADGATNPSSTDLPAGKVYLLTYDGTVFRLGSVTVPVSSVAGRTGAVTLTSTDVGLSNVQNVNQTVASSITSGTLAAARLPSTVALTNAANTFTGYNDVSGGQWRPPESTVTNLPSASGAVAKVFLVTDALGAGNCSAGGGTTRELCRSNGSNYECIGNCGGGGGGGGAGTPGGINGQMQFNGSGSFAGQPFVLNGSVFQRGVECSTGTVNYTSLTANAAGQEISIVTGVTAKFRLLHLILQEATQFASAGVSTLTVSAGRPGVDTDLIPGFALKSASAPQSYWFDRPGTPLLGTGTYDVVLQFVGSSGLGNGTTSNLTAGSVNWEVCGFAIP